MKKLGILSIFVLVMTCLLAVSASASYKADITKTGLMIDDADDAGTYKAGDGTVTVDITSVGGKKRCEVALNNAAIEAEPSGNAGGNPGIGMLLCDFDTVHIIFTGKNSIGGITGIEATHPSTMTDLTLEGSGKDPVLTLPAQMYALTMRGQITIFGGRVDFGENLGLHVAAPVAGTGRDGSAITINQAAVSGQLMNGANLDIKDSRVEVSVIECSDMPEVDEHSTLSALLVMPGKITCIGDVVIAGGNGVDLHVAPNDGSDEAIEFAFPDDASLTVNGELRIHSNRFDKSDLDAVVATGRLSGSGVIGLMDSNTGYGMDAYDTKGNPIVPQSESNTNIFLLMFMKRVLQEYTVTLTASEGGSITGDETVRWSRDASYTITPDEGYTLAALYLDGEEVEPTLTLTLDRVKADRTIEAVFAPNEE